MQLKNLEKQEQTKLSRQKEIIKPKVINTNIESNIKTKMDLRAGSLKI